MRNNSIILIAVRLKSKRLKKKSIVKLYDKPLIIHLTERVAQSKMCSDVIWCTSKNKQDDELEDLAIKNDIKIFRGSEKDVMSRFIEVGDNYKAKNIVRVTGDNPLTDPEIIDYLIKMHNKNNSDYTYCNTSPIGTRSEIICLNMLKKCYKLIQDPQSSEYMTWMLNRPDYFKVQILNFPNLKINRPEISLSVDDIDDLNNVGKIYRNFKKNIPNLETIIKWIDKNPALLKKLTKLKKRINISNSNINCKFKNE